MGISSSGGANSPLSGGLGNLIFYVSGGRQLSRMKGRTGKTAKTPAVKSNREGFGKIQNWLNPLKSVLELGFKNNIPHTGAMALAFSFLSRNARTGKGAEAVIHPEKMRISIGDLPVPTAASAELDGQELVLTWDTSLSGSQSSAFDQVLLAAYEVEEKFAVCLTQGLFRRDGGVRIPLSEPGTYHLYLGMVAKNSSRQGDGIYLGEFKVSSVSID